MSAHPASQRSGWLAALAAQASAYVFEPAAPPLEPEPLELEPYPVVAVVSAAPRCGASTVARLLAAELATRAEGSALLALPHAVRRTGPPSRPAIRLATALAGAVRVQPCGRLCVAPVGVAGPEALRERLSTVAAAARYLAPVVIDLPPDGSGVAVAGVADRTVVVGRADGEPALLAAVASILGPGVVRVVTRGDDPADRADFAIGESRLAGHAAALGSRAVGSVGADIVSLADALLEQA